MTSPILLLPPRRRGLHGRPAPLTRRGLDSRPAPLTRRGLDSTLAPLTRRGLDSLLLRLTLAGAALAVAGATGIAIAARTRRSAAEPQAVPVQPVPPAMIPGLTETIGKIATAYGDRAPAEIAVVATTLRQALAVMTWGDDPPRGDGTPVYLVAMRGRFTALASPPGVPTARGPHLCVVLGRATLAVLEVGIGGRPPRHPLASLGAPVHLAPAYP